MQASSAAGAMEHDIRFGDTNEVARSNSMIRSMDGVGQAVFRLAVRPRQLGDVPRDCSTLQQIHEAHLNRVSRG